MSSIELINLKYDVYEGICTGAARIYGDQLLLGAVPFVYDVGLCRIHVDSHTADDSNTDELLENLDSDRHALALTITEQVATLVLEPLKREVEYICKVWPTDPNVGSCKDDLIWDDAFEV